MNTTTSQQSLKVLAKAIISKLENRKIIEFNPMKRNDLVEVYFKHLQRDVLTEEDLSEQTRKDVIARLGEVSDANLTESDAYRSQKKALKSKYEDNAVSGFYLKSPLRTVVQGSLKFLFDQPLIEDVFESDEVIQKLVMDAITTFDESKIA